MLSQNGAIDPLNAQGPRENSEFTVVPFAA